MSHVFQVSDEAYRTLLKIAATHGQTPEDLFTAWVKELRSQMPHPPAVSEMSGVYDPARDPLAPFLGAFEATEPDVVQRHDTYLGEAAADTHAS